MKYLLIIGVVMALVCFPHLRNILLHLPQVAFYAPKDLYKFIRYKKYNECKEHGHIRCFSSDSNLPFGNGKTLSGVEYLLFLVKKYDKKTVWSDDEKKFVKQRIMVLSNVKITGVPEENFEFLKDTKQIVDFQGKIKCSDVGIVFIDEAGSQFNSRNFKTNISSTLLTSFLSCRHAKFGMIITSPRFKEVDALIRDITGEVSMCYKKWRSVVLKTYNGYDLEYCQNTDLLKCSITHYFATDKLFSSYDTRQTVEEIKRMQANGELLSDSEVLALRGEGQGGLYNARGLNRKGKKVLK